MIEIEFNKILELIFGLYYCVDKDYQLFNPNTFLKSTLEPYCEEFYNLYSKHASEELKEYIKNGGLVSYDTTGIIALSLDENYNFIDNSELESISKAFPQFNKEKLSTLLKDFVEKSNYEEFYKKHQKLYETLINKYKTALNKYVKFSEELITKFYGYKLKDMKIYLFNFVNGSFGINLGNTIININSVMLNEKLEFSPRIINTCFHEFSHPYINPLGNKFFNNTSLSNLLEESISNNLENCYQNHIDLINEYLVRAVQVYLASKYMEEDYIQRQIIYHKNRGYTYIEEIINLLDRKDNYSSFIEFYKNEIVPFFLELNNKKVTPKI